MSKLQPIIVEGGQAMSVPILDSSAWREYRGRPGNPGINVSTHLAKIADETGKERLCYVKLLPNPLSPALLCEALGWVLAGHAEVSRAEFAAIVMVDVATLRSSQLLSPEFDSLTFCPAWCSQAVPGAAVLNHPKRMDFMASRRAFLRAQDSRKIAAFDQWSDLRDRNFGNVIRSSKGDTPPLTTKRCSMKPYGCPQAWDSSSAALWIKRERR